MANTGDGDSLCILSNPCVREWTPIQLHYFREVAQYLAHAWRIRKALDAPGAPPRDVLREAVLAQDRSRTDEPPAHPLWQALLAGQWSLLDSFLSEGTRYVVACQNPAQDLTLRALQPRERSVLEFALAGRSGKWIAYELDRSEATVGRALRKAERRLGLVDTTELVGLRTALFEPLEVHGVTLAVARLPPATASGELSDAERSIVTGILGGKRVAAIAQERGTSPRTVSNQIASAYRKLGVSSRREVIALLA
jgi:DNA-binding NarL/FixJ family response regulator